MDPAQLEAHFANWRTHSQVQQAALLGAIHAVGYTVPVLVSQRTGRVLDGHCRVMLALRESQSTIPVTYLDVDEAEELLILSTTDPLAALAGADTEKLGALLQETHTGDAALMQMLSALAQEHGIVAPDFAPVGIEQQGRLDQKKPIVCPHCGESFTP